MDIDDKMLADLAEQLGLGTATVSKSDHMSDLADKYKGKSDQELIQEILKVKQSLKANKPQFDKQMKTIKALRSMMQGEQKARLERLIRLLEADD
jgi:DNA replicative helicase MCM subunit Mcm2 (Cdc46/Mcm family)